MDAASLHLSAVTIGELQAGAENVRGKNPPKAAEIEAWIDLVLGHFIILPADATIYRLAATSMHRKPKDFSEDAMIAATAIMHRLTVATRNTRDFIQFPIQTLNPFDLKSNVSGNPAESTSTPNL